MNISVGCITQPSSEQRNRDLLQETEEEEEGEKEEEGEGKREGKGKVWL